MTDVELDARVTALEENGGGGGNNQNGNYFESSDDDCILGSPMCHKINVLQSNALSKFRIY